MFLLSAVSHLSSSKDRSTVQDFLVELSQEDVTMETVKAELSNIDSVKVSESFVADYAGLLSAGNSFRESSGLSAGQVILNGIVLEELDDIEEQIITAIQVGSDVRLNVGVPVNPSKCTSLLVIWVQH